MDRHILILAFAIGLLSCTKNGQSNLQVPETLASQTSEALTSDGLNLVFKAKTRAAYDEIISELQNDTPATDNYASRQLALIYVLTKQNKWPEAENAFKALKPNKHRLTETEHLWFEALSARISDDISSEIEHWKTITRTESKSRWAWYELATRHYRREQYMQAVQAIEKALAIEPSPEKWQASSIHYIHSKASFRLGQIENAVKVATPALAFPETRRAAYYRKAMAKIALAPPDADPYKHLELYHEYSKRNGRVNEAFYNANLSLFFFELGQYDMAVHHAKESYALSQEPYPSFVMGYSLTEKGEIKEALSILETATTQHPENVNILGAQAWAFYRAGDSKAAYATLKKAQSLSPRKHSAIERDLKIVEASINDPSLEQVPPVRWYGD